MSDPLDRLVRAMKIQDDESRKRNAERDFQNRKYAVEMAKKRKRQEKQHRKAG